jgi:hypothetical protein
MSSYDERMADILLADYERWLKRQRAESNDPESRAALDDWSCETPLLKGLGMVIPPRKYPNRQPRTRTVGVAAPALLGDSDAIHRLASCDVNPTVRVIHSDGSEEILPTSTFKRNRKSRLSVRKPATVEPPTHRTTAADLKPLFAD